MVLKVPVTEQDHIQGSKNAPITLVEYGDYECPYCGKAYPMVKAVQKHFGNKLRFVFRNFPLKEAHPHAEMAAEAAEFAATKGIFWEMHDRIYENQDHLSIENLLELGQSLGLSVEELKKALQKSSFEDKIQKDFIEGIKSGVNGTPTFFINGQRYDGNYDYDSLVNAIDSILVKV